MTPTRILLAEDHYVSRQLLERNLAAWGFDVATAADGEQALRLLQSMEAPALALIDWTMPGLDGLELCRQIRGALGRPYTYLILLAAPEQKGKIATALEAEVDDYMIKPFDLEELRARLKIGERVAELERQLAMCDSEIKATTSTAKQVRNLLPICTYCKSIRDDAAYWLEIEEYIRRQTGAELTHGICPACMETIQNFLRLPAGTPRLDAKTTS